jgi:transaldolase/transaldolase/glucose-6-phosphate isomerase
MSPKDPSYPDVIFVNALIGPGTVATLPLQTLTAFCDHGDPSCRQKDDLDAARAMTSASGICYHLEKVNPKLEEEGIDKIHQAI